MARDPEELDSYRELGGMIPGTPGIHAYTLSGPKPSAIPVLVAVPHAGRAYTAALLRSLRDPAAAALRLEDRLADSLGQAVAKETGATLLVAHAPRAMIDLNRAPDDVDWEMFERSDRPGGASAAPSRRARSGLGLIPRRVPGAGELWKRQHSAEELSARIAGIHAPYHEKLAAVLKALRERWGAAVLLDLHSMPSIPPQGPSVPPQYVVGDRFGASCHSALVGAATGFLDQHGCAIAHNRPYAGGYGLERHGDPERGIHAMQMEIDRSVYLDAGLARLGPGYARLVRLISGLVRVLATEATLLAAPREWRDAAE